MEAKKCSQRRNSVRNSCECNILFNPRHHHVGDPQLLNKSMKKTLIAAAVAALTLTAQAIEEGYQAEIYKEAYKTLTKYKEVSLVPSVRGGGVTKVSKLKTRPFKKENHGLMKPRSLEGWLVPVRLPSDERLLWLSFKVEVLDFPKLGRVEAIKEFHSIIDIKLVTPFDDDKAPKAVNGWPWMKVVKLKDKDTKDLKHKTLEEAPTLVIKDKK